MVWIAVPSDLCLCLLILPCASKPVVWLPAGQDGVAAGPLPSLCYGTSWPYPSNSPINPGIVRHFVPIEREIFGTNLTYPGPIGRRATRPAGIVDDDMATMRGVSASMARSWRSEAARNARVGRVRGPGREGRRERWARTCTRAQDGDRQAEELEEKLAVGSRKKVRWIVHLRSRWIEVVSKRSNVRCLTRVAFVRLETRLSPTSTTTTGNGWCTSTCSTTNRTASFAGSFANHDVRHVHRFEDGRAEGVLVGRFQDARCVVLVEPPHFCHHHPWLQWLGGVPLHRTVAGLV